jgi:hypothetical protein
MFIAVARSKVASHRRTDFAGRFQAFFGQVSLTLLSRVSSAKYLPRSAIWRFDSPRRFENSVALR